MLVELELELLTAIKASPIAAYLKEVAAMPDGDGVTLTQRFAAGAPGVYVVAGNAGFVDGLATVMFDCVCIARNARGSDAARRGDGVTIGLYQMLDGLAAFLECHRTASTVWQAKALSFAKGKVWNDAGISAGSLSVTAEVLVGGLDMATLGSLDNFVTFHADYDIAPFQTATEHVKWLAEPQNLTTGQPELSETLTLPG